MKYVILCTVVILNNWEFYADYNNVDRVDQWQNAPNKNMKN